MGFTELLTVWIFITTGCMAYVSGDDPLGLRLPPIMHVARNWYSLTSDPVGTVVTHVQRERTGNQPVRFGLETSGPPVPFRIDASTGIVYVNETLRDKVNQSYSLWVTANDGALPQKTEVWATITDTSGQRPRAPRPPPFQSSSGLHPFPYPGILNIPTQHVLLPPKRYTTQPTTKVTEEEIDEQTELPEILTTSSTLGPPMKPEDIFNVTSNVKDDTGANNDSSVSSNIGLKDNEIIKFTIIPVAVIFGLIVAGGVAAFMWKRYKGQRSKSKKEDMSKETSGIVLQDASLHGWEGPRAYSNRYESWDNGHLQISEESSQEKQEPRDEWEFPRHRLRIFNIVGEGAFGQVWRAQATDIDGKKGEHTVAVKTLKENASEKEKTDLLQELVVMKGLGTHPNVVRLVGCCTDKEPTFVIMEFVSLGKLQSFLRDSRAERHYGNTHGGSRSLTSRDLTHFAYQVARGMDFLSSKGIIHRDLAARNVLITEERTCKVADFGFARDVAGSHVYERKSDGRLPIRWMAPESLYDDIFSVKSDIWSFGVLVWEIVTLGSTPYPGLSAGDVMRKVRDGHRLEKPEHCRRELYNIMYYCWEAEPSARPDFAECVSLLERLLCTETDYIELERFPDHSYYNVQHLDGEKL